MDVDRKKPGQVLLAWLVVLAGVGTLKAEPLTTTFVDRLAPAVRAMPTDKRSLQAETRMACDRPTNETANEEVAVRGVGCLEMVALCFVIPPVLNQVEATPFITPRQPTPKVTPTDNAHIQGTDVPPPKTDASPPPDAPEPASLVLGLLGCGVGGIMAAVKRRRQKVLA